MKKSLLLVSVLLLQTAALLVHAEEQETLALQSVTPAANLPAYYSSLNNLSGKSLFDEVHDVAKVGYSALSYKQLWTAFGTTDLIPGTNQIWDMYSDCTFAYQTKQCGSYTRECSCYNREHSIPKSWFGGAESRAGADLFHIVPTDGYVNNKRSNQPFGEVSNATYTFDDSKLGTPLAITITGGNTIAGAEGTSFTCSASPVFEPQDQYKGDFARGYLGTMIRWANGDYQMFIQEDGSTTFSDGYDSAHKFGLTSYGVALLMNWHRQDPVSQKEIDRNNGIQATQGNRNPFIDYPYLAEFIWGEKAGQTVSMSQLVGSFESDFVPGQSNGWRGQSADVPVWEKPSDVAEKVIINGQIYILRGDKTYDIFGRMF